MNFSVSEAALEAADTIAIIDGQRRLTWRELARAVSKLTMPARTPIVTRPTISTTSALEIIAALDRGDAMILRHPARPAKQGPSIGTLARGHIAIETSGTRGQPTLVTHRHSALLAHASASAEALGSEPDDRWLVCLPLAHVSGLAPLVRALAYRRGVILESSFEPHAIARSIAENRATLVSVVPVMLRRLVESGWRPPGHVRHVLVGGARTPETLAERARANGIPIARVYGMTETFSHIAINGHPLTGVECRVDNDGALSIRSPTATAWPQWYQTGDLATIASDGRLSILGRRDDVIITGGENVSPQRVEQALCEQAGVQAAAVIGLADETWGQAVAAAIVGTSDLDLEVVDTKLRASLAPFERPRRFLVLGELPRGQTGKVDRAALARLFEQSPTG